MRNRILAVTLLLVLTLSARAWLSAAPVKPARRPLAEFPMQIGEYKVVNSRKIEDDVQKVLKADDYIDRRYVTADGRSADLFIAFYEAQRAGESMHSPKNCLPGSGWEPVLSDTIQVPYDGSTVAVNRYVVENAGHRSLILYWYQSPNRIIASEYAGKFYLVYDAIKTKRRDGAIVRLVFDLPKSASLETVQARATSLASAVLAADGPYLPN